MFDKKKVVSVALASTIGISAIAPAASASTVKEGTVTAHSLTVRTGPSAKHDAKDWLKNGDKVTILKDHGAFSYVQYDGNKQGYVHDGYLSITEKKVSSSADTATVTAHSLTVRSGPSVSYKAQDWLKKGDSVTVLKKDGTFWHIQYDGKKKGYVHKDFLKASTKKATKSSTSSSASKPSTSTGKTATVTAHSLTVRTGPSVNYKAQDWLKNGDKVTVLKEEGAFSHIQYGKKKGYVHSGYIKASNGTSTPAPSKPKQDSAKQGKAATVTAHSLTVRTGPAVSYKAQDWLKKGDKVTVLKQDGSFSHIQYGNKKGYVHSGYLSNAKSSPPKTNTPSEPKAPSNASTYTVKSGDTLWSISQAYGTTVSNLKSLNGLSSNTIKVGQKLTVTGTASKPSSNQSQELHGKLIVIDPGHGGKYAGAQGIVKEEVVNLEISLKLRDELQRLGATVIMTRTGNTHLHNAYSSDPLPALALPSKIMPTCLSRFTQTLESAASGTEVYWMNSGRGDQKLAQNIVNNIASETGLNNRGAKYANFAVLRNSGANIPSVLVETGFVTNSHDASLLGSASGQQKFATSIAKGIAEYYK